MIRSNVSRAGLIPKHVFRISRASRPKVDNVFLVLEQNGIIGYGEASPNSFFKEDAESVHLTLLGLNDFLKRQTLQHFQDIERIWNEVWPLVTPSRACQCAIDIALWDLWSKLQQLPASELAFGKIARPILTSVTLGISEPTEWTKRIQEIHEFKSIKVKMDERADLEILKRIRLSSQATIRVDANCAWNNLEIEPLSLKLKEFGVEFIEQPFAPTHDHQMEKILQQSPLPIFADESCVGLENLSSLVGRFSGINIKLVKCGGITPALKMVALGKKLGLKSMVGCMLESSLLISAGTLVAQEADYADLDGSWLLKSDPFAGLEVMDGKINIVWAPGLGVTPKEIETGN